LRSHFGNARDTKRVMATPSLGDAQFQVACCARCDKEVLTHVVDIDIEGNEVRRCLHCDGEVTGDPRAIPASELEGYGYTLIEARSCGNGGGCSTGCGMRSRS
jgi:hypothetical protein